MKKESSTDGFHGKKVKVRRIWTRSPWQQVEPNGKKKMLERANIRFYMSEEDSRGVQEQG